MYDSTHHKNQKKNSGIHDTAQRIHVYRSSKVKSLVRTGHVRGHVMSGSDCG